MQNKYKSYAENISESNCNARLTALYDIRDRIGNRIDKLIVMGYNTEAAEEEHDIVCDIISKLCDFRRTHNCLLEGDKGYGL